MALWKDPVSTSQKDPAAVPRKDDSRETDRSGGIFGQDLPRRSSARSEARDTRESVIAADLTIEGKIEGSGHVRIAGRFNGDVNVEGNLTIEPGARLTGEVRARTVVVGGELQGNIDAASAVQLTETGIMNGDVKAPSLTVAAGSRMRGHVEFGWEDRKGVEKLNPPGAAKKGDGNAA